MLPALEDLRLEGSVAPGEGIDFFGLTIGPGSRSLSASYHRLPDQQWGGVIRIWLTDAEGIVIDSWSLDPSSVAIELKMLALRRPEPTVLYLGIEAISEGSNPIRYALEVHREGGGGGGPDTFLFPGTASPTTSAPPPTGGSSPGRIGSESGSDLSLGLISGSGSGPETGAIGSSGGVGAGFGFLEVSNPLPIDLGPGISRPLPTQASAGVGGLLPAGPVVRGDSGAPGPAPRGEAFADPVLLAAGPMAPDDLDESTGDPLSRFDGSGGPSIASRDASSPALDLPRPPLPPAGPEGITRLLAGLRLALAGSALPTPSTVEELEVPDELRIPVEAVLPPEPVDPGRSVALPVSSRTLGAVSLRPQVLRTALLGAAVLAVGLILPDLAAADRPGLRHRSRWALPIRRRSPASRC